MTTYIFWCYIKQIMNAFHSCDSTDIFIRWKIKCFIQLAKVLLDTGYIHLYTPPYWPYKCIRMFGEKWLISERYVHGLYVMKILLRISLWRKLLLTHMDSNVILCRWTRKWWLWSMINPIWCLFGSEGHVELDRYPGPRYNTLLLRLIPGDLLSVCPNRQFFYLPKYLLVPSMQAEDANFVFSIPTHVVQFDWLVGWLVI